MLQYSCPEKRRQALRGRNRPRDIRAEVHQGALAPTRQPSFGANSFAALDHRAMPPKIPGSGAEPQLNLLPLFLLLFLLRPLDAAARPLPDRGREELLGIKGLSADTYYVQAQDQLPHHRDQGTRPALGMPPLLHFIPCHDIGFLHPAHGRKEQPTSYGARPAFGDLQLPLMTPAAAFLELRVTKHPFRLRYRTGLYGASAFAPLQ
jgi:hypothetical protein